MHRLPQLFSRLSCGVLLVGAVLVGGLVTARPAAALSPIEGYWDEWNWVSGPGPQFQAMRIAGWAATADYPTGALGVRVTIAGYPLVPDWDFAGGYRGDVGAAMPWYGPWHGFDFTFIMPQMGWQTVCVQAQNNGVYSNLPGNGCRLINTNEAGAEVSFTPQWNRFRYSDPVIRINYVLQQVSGQSFSVAHWNTVRARMGLVNGDTAGRILPQEGTGSSGTVYIQKVASPAGNPNLQGVLNNVYTTCGTWTYNVNGPLSGTSAWVGCYVTGAVVQLGDDLWNYDPNLPQATTHEFGHALMLGHMWNYTNTPMCAPVCGIDRFQALDQSNLLKMYR